MSQALLARALPVPLKANSTARVTISSMNVWLSETTYYFGIVTSSGQKLPAWPEHARSGITFYNNETAQWLEKYLGEERQFGVVSDQ